MMVLLALGTLRGCVQRDGLLGDARRVADQIERFDQFVAGKLMLPAEAIGIGALLNFVVRRNSVATMPAPDCILT